MRTTDLLRLALETNLDLKTVRRFVKGQRTHASTSKALRSACKRLGLTDPTVAPVAVASSPIPASSESSAA